jgi:hypothetical protein
MDLSAFFPIGKKSLGNYEFATEGSLYCDYNNWYDVFHLSNLSFDNFDYP